MSVDRSFAGAGVDDDTQGRVRELPMAAASPLEALKKAFSQIQSRSDEIRLPHPGAKHIEFVFNRHTVTDYDLLSRWAKASEDDQMRFACTLLMNACEDIVVDGKSSGMSLSSPQLQEITATMDQVAAVQAFFDKNFIWIRTLAGRVTAEAGKEDEEGLDPTPEVSTS